MATLSGEFLYSGNILLEVKSDAGTLYFSELASTIHERPRGGW
jgi:hypothetical protein